MTQQKETTKDYLALTIEQVQQLGNYLVARPYGEVSNLIDLLKSAPTVKVAQPVAAPVETPVAGEDSAPEAAKSLE